MKHTNSNKSSGFDEITGKILYGLSSITFRAILRIFNAVLRLSYDPNSDANKT